MVQRSPSSLVAYSTALPASSPNEAFTFIRRFGAAEGDAGLEVSSTRFDGDTCSFIALHLTCGSSTAATR